MESVWTATVKREIYDELKDDIKTDVLVIGGGIAGILSAYMLTQAGVECVLVEADRICRGITKNTTAKITSQHGLIYDKLAREFDIDTARMYLEANEKAIDEYRKLCSHIECSFEEKPAFVYTMDKPHAIEKELKTLQKIGFNAKYEEELPIPLLIECGIRFANQAQFNPLKFLFALSKKIRVFEKTKVVELKKESVNGSSVLTAVTNNGKISAKKIIVATHFPFINKHGVYFLKMYQHRSYVIAVKNVPRVKGMYVDENDKGMSFRDYEDLVLIGGGSHRTGKKGGNWAEIETFAARRYPKSEEMYRWATQDCMTLDGMPYIGLYSENTPDMYVTTGFNKWGMTSAMAGAMILRDMITGKQNDYAEIFSPSRTIIRPQLLVNAFESTAGLLTPTVPRCPHLGCALKYNKDERSWDCSCHGSRFTEEGQLIDNPATGDKKNI